MKAHKKPKDNSMTEHNYNNDNIGNNKKEDKNFNNNNNIDNNKIESKNNSSNDKNEDNKNENINKNNNISNNDSNDEKYAQYLIDPYDEDIWDKYIDNISPKEDYFKIEIDLENDFPEDLSGTIHSKNEYYKFCKKLIFIEDNKVTVKVSQKFAAKFLRNYIINLSLRKNFPTIESKDDAIELIDTKTFYPYSSDEFGGSHHRIFVFKANEKGNFQIKFNTDTVEVKVI